MNQKLKPKIIYVAVITTLYFIIRSIVEQLMDGTWLPRERWVATVLEGIAAGIILLWVKAGRGKDKMPN